MWYDICRGTFLKKLLFINTLYIRVSSKSSAFDEKNNFSLALELTLRITMV